MRRKTILVEAINYLIFQHEDVLKSSQVSFGIKGQVGSPSLDIDKQILFDLQKDLEQANAGQNLDELESKYSNFLDIAKAA